MSDSLTLPVHEVFHTFQGEGVHMGRSAFFIRTFGCPVHCPWCDSAGTWHKDFVPKNIDRYPVEMLAAMAWDSKANFVVLTGGEPAIHDIHSLIKSCHENGQNVHLETSGGFPIKGVPDWITLSPKKWGPPMLENIRRASEFKFIIEEPDDIELYNEMIQLDKFPHDYVWLHPEWSQRKNEKVLAAISNAVKEYPNRYRAGWQLHKLYQVDFLDRRSRLPVPLGGDFRKGL